MEELRKLVAEELSLPVDPRVKAIAAAIAANHGDAAQAVLFYGSCLRQKQLDGLVLDFYLIVSDYRAAYRKGWLAAANRLIPPNVFYFEHGGRAAKYAVLSEQDFAHECSAEAWNVSTVARFAQPSRLAWSANEAAAQRAIDIVGTAAPTLLSWTLPLIDDVAYPHQLWTKAFTLTFNAELRAERAGRAASLVDADPERYERLGLAALQEIARIRGVGMMRSRSQAARWWWRKQVKGKLYSFPRLAKASFTFAGGADYIAWKINRHAGTKIALTPWQRRHPLLAGLSLLPRLLKSGAVR